MHATDLRKEIAGQRAAVAALRLAVRVGKEKGTHLLKAGRKQLARMLTVLREVQKKPSVPVD
jgi:ribosomal protein L29